MIRTSFIDAVDEFYLDEDGRLVHRNDEGATTILVQKENLKAFTKFVNQEADKLEWSELKAEGQTNG